MKEKFNTLIKNEKSDWINILYTCLGVLAVLAAIWTFTGKWPWLQHAYNSYTLQAQAWAEGRLHLGKDYPHLELAIFNGSYFVSFPPFPSYVIFPFVLLGINNCEWIILLAVVLFGAAYTYKTATSFGLNGARAMLVSLLLTVGSNWLFTAQASWVWFIAQSMAFTFTVMAVYYAKEGKAGFSLFFWACAVGCRPLQIIYIFVLLYLLFRAYREKDESATLMDMIKQHWISVIPMAVMAISYMLLNYARFGNPIEFGHNYLPEFTRVETGQFNLAYLGKNIKNLFRLPMISLSEAWEYQKHDGTSIFLVSPVITAFLAYTAYSGFKKEKIDWNLVGIVAVSAVLELLLTAMHKTMGGAHFGNRYPNDILPMIFIGLLAVLPKSDKHDGFIRLLLLWGLTVNAIGSAMFYM